MKYRFAIFDFDGTLADSFPWFLQTVNLVADVHGFKRIEHDEVEALRGYSARQMLKHLGLPMWKLPAVASHIRRLMADDVAHIALFEGVSELLSTLASHGIKLGLVTSNSRANVERILGPANAALIDHYECGATLFGKARKFARLLKAAGMEPEEGICLGDEIRDAEAARAVGIDFGAVTWGYTNREALQAQAPAYLFAHPRDIESVLAARGTGSGRTTV